jgi:uncharacterized protein YbjT (DUF2867 family)
MPKEISVIITGPTGTAGSGVLKACLEHPAVKKVSILTRQTIGKKNENLVEIVHKDFLDYSNIEDMLAGHDACFWCLGVSQSKVRKKEDYTRITYDYTMEAAKVLERLNPGMTFCFLSGLGTDQTEKSRMMWARVKGRAEKDLGKFNFSVYNFRPGFIHAIKGQKSSSTLGRFLYPFIKNSPKYSVEADEFGLAMINAALHGCGKRILENRDIRKLAKGYKPK